MSSMPLIPKQAAIAVADMIDNCAKVKAGMNVLVVAANDGLAGGVNIVDRETVAWLHAAIVQRGADATVVWCDIPYRPMVLWGDGADPSKAWRVPPIVANAMRAADVVISNAVDLTYEEELREIPDILEERNIKYARNMATTGGTRQALLGSAPSPQIIAGREGMSHQITVASARRCTTAACSHATVSWSTMLTPPWRPSLAAMISTFMPGLTLAQLSTISATAIAACLGINGIELTISSDAYSVQSSRFESSTVDSNLKLEDRA